MLQNGEILNADYPYVSGDTMVAGTCSSAGLETLDLLQSPGYTPVEASYEGLKNQLLLSPVKLSYEFLFSFLFYKNGVYQTTECLNTTEALNHEFTAVGFGV
jgi:hypothetical protein